MTLRLNQTPDELRLEQLAQEILPKDRPKRGRPRKREVAANPGIADALLEYHSLTAGGKGKTVKWVGFQQQYRNDPVAFVHDCLYWDDGKGPSFYQDEIIGGLPEWKRAAIRGPHGLGKTAMMAWKTWWWALTRDGLDWKCPSTASSWNQLIKYLWPEIHKWSKKVRWDKVGRAAPDRVHELQTLALKLGTGEAFAVTSDQPELIEGCHADHLLFLYDPSGRSTPSRGRSRPPATYSWRPTPRPGRRTAGSTTYTCGSPGSRTGTSSTSPWTWPSRPGGSTPSGPRPARASGASPPRCTKTGC
jgi:hypothetical protein